MSPKTGAVAFALLVTATKAQTIPPVGTIGNGTCGATNYGLDCNAAPKGSFPGMKTFEDCVAKLGDCKQANFVSWSLAWNDCSWYSTCDWDHLCVDVTNKTAPNCPGNPGSYHPFTSEVLHEPVPTTVTVTWQPSGEWPKTVETAATVEVDVMPFLGDVNVGGPFEKYKTALEGLGASPVRFSPWYPYPYVVVPEMDPPDCTEDKPATNWNSTLFDGIVQDFMAAVCGPDAVKGACKHSVAQQLSTMPVWLYEGAYPIPAGVINPNPWEFNAFNGYNRGNALVNETCTDMASYVARIVSHYTQGGHTDTCGHWHPSGFHYNWTVLSFLNENEHGTGMARYTRCWDATRRAVEKVNSYITMAGPELVLYESEYTHSFIDPANHDDKRAPEIVSMHAYEGMQTGASGAAFFTTIDKWLSLARGVVTQRDAVAPKAKLFLSEWIPFVVDWCDPVSSAELFATHGDALGTDSRSGGACPDWKNPNSAPAKINRATLGWNAAAAAYAYGYGTLAQLGFNYVASDQLIGGVWPDNEPAVTSLDWTTGEPNAKYYIVQMIASALGFGPKALFEATYSANAEAEVFALPYVLPSQARGLLLISKSAKPTVVTLNGPGLTSTTALVLDGSVDGVTPDPAPGFVAPVKRNIGADGTIRLGPFGIAIVDAGSQ